MLRTSIASRIFAFSAILLFALATLKTDAAGTGGGNPPSKKVVVIVNMGDAGPLGASLAKDQKQAAGVYRSLGYEVIELSNDAPNSDQFATRSNLEREMGKLKGVTDFKLDIMGHGRVQNATDVPAEYRDRYPIFKHTEAEKKAGFSGVDFTKEKVYIAVSVTNRQLDYVDENSKAATKTLFEDSIGTTDLRRMFEKLKTNNKGVRSTVHMLNCFGASLGQGLSDMKDVQVFNATENSKTAIQFHDPKTMGLQCKNGEPVEVSRDLGTLNYMNVYYGELTRRLGARKKDIDYNELHRFTAQKMLDDLLPNGRIPMTETIDLPRSAAQNHLKRWCSEHPEVKSDSKTNPETGCDCRVGGLYEALDRIKDNGRLLKKITLPQMLQDVSTISSQATARFSALVEKYCSGPEQTDPNGAIKKEDQEALAKSKDQLERKAISASDTDLKAAEALLKLETPAGKTTLQKQTAYSDLLHQINQDRLAQGLIPYSGVSDVPSQEPRKTELSKMWWSYQDAWRKLKNQNPELKQKADALKESIVQSAVSNLESSREMKIETRSIKEAERGVFKAKNEFDWIGMIEDAKIKRCFVSGQCDGVPMHRRIRKHEDPTQEKKQYALEVTSLFNTAAKFSKDPKQSGETLGKACIQSLQAPPGEKPPGGGGPEEGGPGEGPGGEGPEGPPSVTPPPTPNPCATPGPGATPRPTMAPRPFDTPASLRKFNQSLLECVEKKSDKAPYAAALAVMNSANLTKDTDGRCPYWKANLELYRSDLKCAKNFSSRASSDDIDFFIETLRMGERAP